MDELPYTLTRRLTSLPQHIMCSQCKQIKERADFRVLLSNIESLRRGGSGSTRIWETGTRCKACRDLSKKAKQKSALMSVKHINKLLSVGALNPLVAQGMLKERERRVKMNRIRGQKKAVAARVGSRWTHMAREISQLLITVRSYVQYRQRCVDNADDTYASDHIPALRYYETYRDTLIQVRDRLEAKRLLSPDEKAPSPNDVWQDYVLPRERDAVYAAFEAVPKRPYSTVVGPGKWQVPPITARVNNYKRTHKQAQDMLAAMKRGELANKE